MVKIRDFIQYFMQMILFIRMEYAKNRSLGPAKFISSFKNGFFSVSTILYDLNEDNKRDFLSDWARLRKAARINDQEKLVIDNKLLFHSMNRTDPHIPLMVSVTKQKKLYKIEMDGLDEIVSQDDFIKFVQQFENGLIIKPQTGGGGANISKVYLQDDGLRFEGACKSVEDFYENIVEHQKDFLMTEIIKQTGVIHRIHPDSLNTARILVMNDPLLNKPFIARAVQRFGTKKSGIVDNWTAGGICASIDVETGKIGHGATYPTKEKLEWHKTHPDTKEVFYDLIIPGWGDITDYILKLSEEYFYLSYIGWDIVPMETGFFILEGNANSDVNLIQIHGGLLTDPRVRLFYEHYNVTDENSDTR